MLGWPVAIFPSYTPLTGQYLSTGHLRTSGPLEMGHLGTQGRILGSGIWGSGVRRCILYKQSRVRVVVVGKEMAVRKGRFVQYAPLNVKLTLLGVVVNSGPNQEKRPFSYLRGRHMSRRVI